METQEQQVAFYDVMKVFPKILAATILFLLGAVAALAQPDSRERMFTIYGIEVDERASTAAQARKIALSTAEDQAFYALLQRIVPENELMRFSMPEGAKTSDYVLGLEIVSERNSAVRYLAELNISFEPSKIEQLLGMQNIPYVGISPEPTLVIPMIWQGGGYLLWEETNTLKSIWLDKLTGNRIRHYLLAEGTLQERASITPGKVLNGRQKERLEGLMDKYGAGEILVSAARFVRNSSGRVERLVMLAMDPLGGAEQEIEIFPQFGEQEENMMARAVEQILHNQDALWRAQSLTQFGALQEIRLIVPVSGALAWADTIKRIKSLALVRNVEVIRMALPDSFIQIRFNGNVDQLALAMEQAGLLLLPGKDGYAVLRQEDRDSRIANKG